MKEIPEKLPEKYPKEVKEGPGMDYQDSNLAFPKPVKKKKGWAKNRVKSKRKKGWSGK